MIVSMTGFGRGEVRKNGYEIVSEVRSVNNRFLDIQIKLPKYYFHLEQDMKALVRKYVTRGRINVFVNLNSHSDNSHPSLKINDESVQNYWNIINDLKKKYKISGKVTLDHLLQFSDIITYDDENTISEEVCDTIKEALTESLENLQKMRSHEGQELSTDLIDRIESLEDRLSKVKTISESRFEEELNKLRNKIKELVANEEIDETRLETEIALMVNRIDVTEECVRFRSHNKLFLKAMENTDAVGRKLNFLLQEMTREANTIGAKVNNAEIAHLVVEIKEEVEKVREQVQNIE